MPGLPDGLIARRPPKFYRDSTRVGGTLGILAVRGVVDVIEFVEFLIVEPEIALVGIRLVIGVAVVLVIVVRVVVILIRAAVDIQRGHLAIRLKEGIVILLEGIGQIVIGGDDGRVVLTAALRAGLQVAFERGGESEQGGAGVSHGPTVACQ